MHFLQSLTNHVKVTLYYDRTEPLYGTVAALLEEYRLVNRKISGETVDYLRDTGAAQQLANRYTFLASAAAKDLVIFDCDGKVKPVDGKALAKYALELLPGSKEQNPGDKEEKEQKPEYIRRPVEFLGEMAFTAALLDVTNPKPLNACFLQGHGEHPIEDNTDAAGYGKFKAVLEQNYISVQPLDLLGTNAVPMECNLLIIAGPTAAIPAPELEKIDQYLSQGGRLLALFKVLSINKETGLEKILANWGVGVGNNIIKDPENTTVKTDVIVSDFRKHPIVNPLLGLRLQLILPRSVGALKLRAQAADAPHVEEIAFSGPKSFAEGDAAGAPQSYPLMVAVEKGAITGVVTERGATRMVVVGDSLFLGNRQIDSAANRDFAGFAVNWLLERTQLLERLGPRPIAMYRIVMTKPQLQSVQWVLLAGMPGAALALGALVWLRRRR